MGSASHRTLRRRLLAVGTVSILVTGGGQAAAHHQEGGEPVEGGTFTEVIAADPGSLDPHMSIFGATLHASSYAYDTLLYTGPDGEFVSGLAEAWEETPTSATFTLKEGITCADGSPLTASTVAENFRFVSDPANQSPMIGAAVPPGIGVEADDAARTVTLTSEQPVPFLLRTAGLNLFIVCARGMADRSLLADGTDGTGPFVLEEAVPNDHYTFRAREGYAWGPGGSTGDTPGFPAEAVVRVVANESTTSNLVLSGEANAANLLGPDRQRLASEGLDAVESRVVTGEFFFNHAEGLPTSDVAVRKALMQALDFEELMAVQTSGAGVLPEGLLETPPKVCPGNTIGDLLSGGADLDEAGRILDEAGWTAGDGGVRTKDGEPLSIRAVYITSIDGSAQAMELTLAQWEELGVDVELQGVDEAQFSTLAFETGAWDVFLAIVNVGVPSQLTPFVSGPTPPDGVNFSSIVNPEYDRLVGEATMLTGDEACEQWNAAEQALFAEMNILPFASNTLPWFAQGAEFELGVYGLLPATVRLVES